ncbi:MAG: DUF554 family protein, partial [Spirochaetales bacterium]|nr:DUF554 family protein [Spirochaetales bacterium]
AIETEIEAFGGVLIMMIGVNLLELREIKTANFLPGLVLIVLFVLVKGWISSLR